ncbi:MAG: type III-B CRISPR module-associated Cmr3 family protein [Burkholderiaceae bacterium]
MSTTTHHFIEPLDVLFLRGNQLFGEPGSYGEALMPPWPSVAAGAIRSRMLADDGVDLAAFAHGRVTHQQLGTPKQPGSFMLQDFAVARRTGDAVELLMPLPADLVATEDGTGTVRATALRPTALHGAISSSNPLPLVPVLAQADRAKAASGWWLRGNGWRKHLQGQPIGADDLVKTSDLWGLRRAHRHRSERRYARRGGWQAVHRPRRGDERGRGFCRRHRRRRSACRRRAASGRRRGRAAHLHPATLDWPRS